MEEHFEKQSVRRGGVGVLSGGGVAQHARCRAVKKRGMIGTWDSDPTAENNLWKERVTPSTYGSVRLETNSGLLEFWAQTAQHAGQRPQRIALTGDNDDRHMHISILSSTLNAG
ncbi:hypothetical protein Sjap_002860 [Stephania japonica]|uniref:Uncharacterized protein n=1 Tax=Stephania japonica TaxID=461633 RepID=A0AAP0PUI6_9MAGN